MQQDKPQPNKPQNSANSVHSSASVSKQGVNNSIVLSAIAMALGTMSSRVLGLVRDMAFAALFDRSLTDAWTTAFRLPNMFRRLLGEGALSVSFVPVFVETRLQDTSGARSRNLVNGLYTLLLLLLITLTTLGVVFAEPLLHLMLEATYKNIPGKFELTVRMARIMFSFLFAISTYAYFMGILNALGKYALAAFAPVLWNVTMIVTTFVPLGWLTSPGDAIAWGVVIGGALQALLLVPSLRRSGYFPRLSGLRESIFNPDVLQVLRNMVPGLVGLGLLQITTVINLRFASALGEGPISYIYWADRLMELPLSLVSVSLGTALLPNLAGLWSKGDKQKMIDTANYYLRLNLFVAVPAAIGLWVLALPIVQVLFLRGKFTIADAEATAMVVSIYSLIVFSTSCVRVFVPSFYAIKNTWLPAFVSGVCLLSHVFVAPLLMHHWGLAGLVASSFVSSSLNLFLLSFGYRWLIGPFGLLRVMKSVSQFLIAGFIMAMALRVYGPLLEFFGGLRWLALALSILLGGSVYCLTAWLLGVEELKVSFQTIQAKLAKKIKRK